MLWGLSYHPITQWKLPANVFDGAEHEELDHAMQTRRVEAVRCLFEESMKEQITMLKTMDGELDAQSKSSELILSKAHRFALSS